MGDYMCALKYFTRFKHFYIKQSVAQINKTYTSLDFPARKEYRNLFGVHRVNNTKCLFTMR